MKAHISTRMINGLRNFKYESLNKEIQDDRDLTYAEKAVQINQSDKSDYYNNVKKVYPDYNGFDEDFKLKNNASDDEIAFMYKKKKGIRYVNLKRLEKLDYMYDSKSDIGYTFLKKRKITTGKLKNYISINGKLASVYEYINGTPIGFIPLENYKCVWVMRRKVTSFEIVFPIMLIYVSCRFFLG